MNKRADFCHSNDEAICQQGYAAAATRPMMAALMLSIFREIIQKTGGDESATLQEVPPALTAPIEQELARPFGDKPPSLSF